MSESGVIEKVKEGKVGYFEQIVRRHNTTLFRIGSGYLRREQDVEDMMQNTYLKAYEKLNLFRHESSFSTWLIKIMINECLMFLRKNTSTHIDDVEVLEKTQTKDPLDTLAQNEMKNLIETSVKQLPTNYRIVYMLRCIEGRSGRETAELLEISLENVKVRLHRAKEMLKDQILQQVEKQDLFAYYAKKCDPLTASVMNKILERNPGND